MSHWTEHYLGQPYENAGCWLLFEKVQLDHFKRDVSIDTLPEKRRERLAAFKAGAGAMLWNEVKDKKEGDAVLMTSSRHPHHVGIYVAIGRGRVLHSVEGQGVICTPLEHLKLLRWHILGYYRPAAECEDQ